MTDGNRDRKNPPGRSTFITIWSRPQTTVDRTAAALDPLQLLLLYIWFVWMSACDSKSDTSAAYSRL